MGLLQTRSQTAREEDSKTGELSPDDVAWLKKKVFIEASTGKVNLLSLLPNLSEEVTSDVLQRRHSTPEGTSHTPLTIALSHRHVAAIRHLLETSETDFERNVVQDGEGMTVMTALQIAVVHRNLNMVKALVTQGADVNQTNFQDETSLHAACLHGHLGVVKFLVEEGARTDALDRDGYTCLMRACHRDHTRVVRYLLQKGVNPNQRSASEATALHVVAEIQDSARTAKALVEYGAKLTKDSCGRTPLVKGILLRSRHFVEFILALAPINQQERVDGDELWAAVLATRSIEEAYHYLHKAMAYRYQERNRILRKPYRQSLSAFANINESQTLDQLEARRINTVRLTTECLLIVERLLGADDPLLGCMYTSLCSLLLSQKSFNRAVEVWVHGRKTVSDKSGQLGIYEIFRNIAVSMVSMIEGSNDITSHDVRVVLDLLLKEMEEQASSGSIRARNETEALEYVTSCFLLITKATLADPGSNCLRRLLDLIKRLVEVHPPFCSERPILHHAIGWEAEMDRTVGSIFQQLDWLRGCVLELLLTCGKYLDVNAVDDQGFTALREVARRTDELGTRLATRMKNALIDAGASKDITS